MTKRNIHVTKTENNTWRTLREGADRSSAVFNTQAEAIKEGTKSAQNDKVELFIHGRDGKIRERNTFGNDPFPPKG
jgi:ketosteroid isomerase-like protein